MQQAFSSLLPASTFSVSLLSPYLKSWLGKFRYFSVTLLRADHLLASFCTHTCSVHRRDAYAFHLGQLSRTIRSSGLLTNACVLQCWYQSSYVHGQDEGNAARWQTHYGHHYYNYNRRWYGNAPRARSRRKARMFRLRQTPKNWLLLSGAAVLDTSRHDAITQ